MRVGLFALAVVGLALPVAAQEPLKAGTPVRIVAPALGPDPVLSRLVRLAADSLVLQSDPRLPELAIARSDITRLEVASGRGSGRTRLIGVGLGAGFGAGAILGLALGSYITNPDLQHSSNEIGRTLVGGVIGAGIGVVVGAVVGSTRKEATWKVVDHRTVRVAFRPVFDRGVGAVVRLRFGPR